MKHMKKGLALVLALMLVLVLATTASAYTIELSGSDVSPTTGHTYTVYQIFTGELTETENQLVNVKYGQNYTPGDTTTDTLVPDDVLEGISNAREFADTLVANDKALLKGTYGTLDASNDWKLENVPAGYYLILDTTETLPTYHTRSTYIVQVVDDVKMAPKSAVVTSSKKVKDANDSTGEESGWQDSADHDIGDTVSYQIKSDITDIDEFKTYKVIFTDTVSKGLTYNEDAVITMTYTVVGGAEKSVDVTDAFTITSADYTGTDEKYVGGKVYTFTCEDLKALVANEGNLINATITIDYTCTLNEYAVIGEAGNPNKVNLQYDREPDDDDDDDDELGTTPDDVNIVFTFKTDVNKVDSEGNPLSGAEFTLEKFVASQNGAVTYKGVKGDWVDKELVKNDAGTTFSFTGLDDGYYRITETEAPEGYNSIDPIYFTVTADHDVLADDPTLTSLQADVVKSDGTAYTEEEIASGNIASFTATKKSGELETDIVNRPGVVLPETGGIGTTLFYVIGGLLVIAAVVLLVTKKRMNSAE